jgi:hypothetical protein
LKAKFRLRQELPKIIEKYKTLTPAELHAFILQDFNKDVPSKTIQKFFERNPKLRSDYQSVFSGAANSQIEVSGDLFQNGNFTASPAVRQWIIEKKTLVSPTYLNSHVCALKRVCQGLYYLKNPKTKVLNEVQIPDWTPKSPERITVEQFQEYIGYVHTAGNCTNTYRMAFRDFWLSRTGQTLKPTQVSGEMTTGTSHTLGRWKNVKVSTAKLYAILNYVKERDFVAYAAAFTGYKTNARHTAVLTQFLETKLNRSFEELEDGATQLIETVTIDVTDKGFHRKGRQTSPRLISPDLLAVLQECWRRNGNNAFAGLDDAKLMRLLKEAYLLVLAEDLNADGTPKEYSALELALAEPFHFWHHMFGRKMLEATKYNYTVVAALGGWASEDMLHKVYGAAPMAMLRKEGLAVLPQI